MPEKKYLNCYIDFQTEEDATDALQIDRQVVEGKTLFVAKSKPPEKHDSNKNTLFLNNLPFNTPKEDLLKAIKFCKEDILGLRVLKSFAFATFKSEIAMKKHLKTLKDSHVMIKGRRIIASKADDRKDKRRPDGQHEGDSSQASALASVSKDDIVKDGNNGRHADDGLLIGKRAPLPDQSEDIADHKPEKRVENGSHQIKSQIVEEKPAQILVETPVVQHAKPAGKSNADFRKLLNLKQNN